MADGPGAVGSCGNESTGSDGDGATGSTGIGATDREAFVVDLVFDARRGLGPAHQQLASIDLNLPVRPLTTVIEMPLLIGSSRFIRGPALHPCDSLCSRRRDRTDAKPDHG